MKTTNTLIDLNYTQSSKYLDERRRYSFLYFFFGVIFYTNFLIKPLYDNRKLQRGIRGDSRMTLCIYVSITGIAGRVYSGESTAYWWMETAANFIPFNLIITD